MSILKKKSKEERLALQDVQKYMAMVIKTVWNFFKNKNIKRLQNICQFAVHTRKLGTKRHMYMINGTEQTA